MESKIQASKHWHASGEQSFHSSSSQRWHSSKRHRSWQSNASDHARSNECLQPRRLIATCTGVCRFYSVCQGCSVLGWNCHSKRQ